MKKLILDILRRYKLPIFIISTIIILVGITTTAKIIEITENPAFCGKNCHIMKPYFDSWKTSSHNDVRCVECHYEPGFVGHVKGKINGLMQFYKYQTSDEDYSGKLYARVLDKNCLVCHETRIFSSNIYYLNTNFSHKNHLLLPKRNIDLTCTSCHSMLVIGMKEHQRVTDPSCGQCHSSLVKMGEDTGHIVVTTSTCITCHFRTENKNSSHKKNNSNVPISGCPSCHGPPKETYSGFTSFNHTIHTIKGVECLTCHVNISIGADDIVSQSKCNSCHNIRERVEKYNDIDFVHKNHVTNNKIACYNCHSNVKHNPTVKENTCSKCHNKDHPKDWLMTHKKEVLIGKNCRTCHLPQFCSDCHGKGSKIEDIKNNNT